MPLKLVSATAPTLEALPRTDRTPVLRLAWGGLIAPRRQEAAEFVLHAGETVLLWGADAASRSAVMRAAAGLNAGQSAQPVAPRGVGAVLREPTLPYAATPLETIMACAPVDPVVASDLLERVGLSEIGDKPLNALSRTELRLLRLASAAASAPGALVLDGLFDLLDPVGRRRLTRALACLRAVGTMGVLITGMDRAPLRMLCTRQLELGAAPGGNGTPALLSDRPQSAAPVLVTHRA